MIRKMEEAMRAVKRLGRNPEESELKDVVEECENALSEATVFLDDKMRAANESLRRWGTEEAEGVDSLTKDLADAEYERDEAQQEAKDLREELTELKAQYALLHDYVRVA